MLAAPPLTLWEQWGDGSDIGPRESEVRYPWVGGVPCGWDSTGKSRGRFPKTVGFPARKTQRDIWAEKQGCSHENIFQGDYKTSHLTSAWLKVKVKEIGVL